MVHPDGIHIYIIDIARHAGYSSDYMLLLSDAERQRARAFRSEKRRVQYAVMHGLLRFVLSRYVDLHPRRLAFLHNAHGKPRLHGEIKFNISHSGERGVIGICREEIGIDIERTDPAHLNREMIEGLFTETEKAHLRALDEDETLRAFYRGWVRKESIIKAWGTGLSFPVNRLDTRLDEPGCLTRHADACWMTRDLAVGDSNYPAALTVAAGDGEPSPELFYKPVIPGGLSM